MVRKARGGQSGGRGDRLDAVLLLALAAICAAVLAGFAWTRPIRVPETISYNQVGTLSYTGATSPTSVYGPSGLKTGEPIYFNQVSTLEFTYDYTFQSGSTTSLKGTEQLTATINDGQGITRTVTLQPVTEFTGDKFSATGTVSLQNLQSIVASFSHVSGAQSIGAFTLTVKPNVKLDGSVGAARLKASFDPQTAFSFHAGVLAPSASRSSTSGLSKTHPTTAPALPPSAQSGSVPLPGGQRAAFLGLAVWDVRFGSLGLLAVALLAGTMLGLPLIWEATSEDERVRINRRYGSTLVDVEALPDAPGLMAVDLSSFDGLRQVARRLECPILRRTDAAGDVYAVVDNGTLYRYAQLARPKSTRTTSSRHAASKSRTITVTNSGGKQ